MRLQKLICLLLPLVFGFISTTKAQFPPADTLSAREVRFLTAQLQLDQEQQKKLMTVALAFHLSMRQGYHRPTHNAANSNKELKDLHKEHEDALQAMLTKKQWQQYLELRKKQQERTSEKIKHRKQ